MNKLVRFAEKLGMDVASLILLLVISFAVLAFLANKFNDSSALGFVGRGASWLEAKAQPQG